MMILTLKNLETKFRRRNAVQHIYIYIEREREIDLLKTGSLCNAIQGISLACIGLVAMVYELSYHALQIWQVYASSQQLKF